MQMFVAAIAIIVLVTVLVQYHAALVLRWVSFLFAGYIEYLFFQHEKSYSCTGLGHCYNKYKRYIFDYIAKKYLVAFNSKST